MRLINRAHFMFLEQLAYSRCQNRLEGIRVTEYKLENDDDDDEETLISIWIPSTLYESHLISSQPNKAIEPARTSSLYKVCLCVCLFATFAGTNN